MISIERLVVGELEANCYIVFDADKEGLVIDPGADGERILNAIEGLGLHIVYIINTHGHFDHAGANRILKEETDATLAIHSLDAPLLDNLPSQASMFGLTCWPSPNPDRLLSPGEILALGDERLEVIHTPGHTKGSISIRVNDLIFTGDTLFAGSIGRTDLPGGSYEDIISSIKGRLMVLPEDTIVYPGHGPETKIGWERLHNPFIAGIRL